MNSTSVLIYLPYRCNPFLVYWDISTLCYNLSFFKQFDLNLTSLTNMITMWCWDLVLCFRTRVLGLVHSVDPDVEKHYNQQILQLKKTYSQRCWILFIFLLLSLMVNNGLRLVTCHDIRWCREKNTWFCDEIYVVVTLSFHSCSSPATQPDCS